MKAVVFHSPGRVELKDLPLPIPGPGEARLRVLLAGVCRTDQHIVAGHFPVRGPRVLGHELVGVVEAVGEGVSPGLLGETFGVLPARFCGECPVCRRGLPELCQRFECLGNTHDGAFAGAALVRADQLRPLNGISPASAVWLEPLACVLRALELAGSDRDAPLLIAGAGVLGRLMLLAAASAGFSRLAVVDPNPHRLQAALDCGAGAGWVIPRSGPAPELDAALTDWAPEGPLAVVDTSGAPETLERAVRWSAPGGRIVLFGVPDPAARACLPPSALLSKELNLLAASGMTPASFEQAEDLLRSGRLDPGPLVSEVLGLEPLPELLLSRGPRREGKVLVQPDASPQAG